MTFRFSALPIDSFVPFFALSDEALASRNAVWRVADGRPMFPCRVSLRDATAGERVLLLSYEHQPARTPYRSAYAIYVREHATQAHPEIGEVPDLLRSRVLSVRAFDGAGMLADADVTEGRALEEAITRMLSAREVEYLHVHFARPGCYAARVDRADRANPSLEWARSG